MKSLNSKNWKKYNNYDNSVIELDTTGISKVDIDTLYKLLDESTNSTVELYGNITFTQLFEMRAEYDTLNRYVSKTKHTNICITLDDINTFRDMLYILLSDGSFVQEINYSILADTDKDIKNLISTKQADIEKMFV